MPHSADYGTGAPRALVIAETGAATDTAAHAVELAGCRARQVRWTDAAHDPASFDGLDLIVIEAEHAPDGLLDIVLARADTVARERALGVVAAIRADQIDAAAAHLLGPRVQLLCDPSTAERVTAITAIKWTARGTINDVTREPESARLQRLNEEVARIADTLARLTRGEEPSRGGVRDNGLGYRGPETVGSAGEATATELRAVIRARRLRAQFFHGELFADPAWDMLLDLFAADMERRRVSVSSLCIAAAVPPTTALRWIGTMHDAGLFERQADPTDRRRAYIALSAKGLEGMRSYIAAVKRAGLHIV
ncbi:winged helix DNA-binding protein [Sphingomonas sp. CJ20]